ncbi:MAG: type VI secretion system transmembrane protein TssO [Prevotella sp.]|nr:type VI secretion system transmembrane protein TssO [Prevotella sp.]MDR3057660.1 type VI secretion system transmembrane protein TssO [Prevotella sp.]
MNSREKIMGFIYILIFFLLVSVVCCVLIFNHNSDFKSFAQKDFAITKMERIKDFQDKQNTKYIVTDSLFNKIRKYNPAVKAIYEENEIKLMLNDLEEVYNKNTWDKRYKVFSQISNLYNMWYMDKKELWSKRENIAKFKKGIEDCQMGRNRRGN